MDLKRRLPAIRNNLVLLIGLPNSCDDVVILHASIRLLVLLNCDRISGPIVGNVLTHFASCDIFFGQILDAMEGTSIF